MADHDGWQWQGRQEHGWFGHGTKPQSGPAGGGRGGAYGSAPTTLDERIRALGHAAIAGLPASKRYYPAASFDGPALERLVGAMRAWVGGLRFDHASFAARFFDRHPSSPVVGHLRRAAEIVAGATTSAEVREATDALAAAMLAVGLDGWLRFLKDAHDRAMVTGASQGRRSDPLLVPVQAGRRGGSGPTRMPGGGWRNLTPGQEILVARYNAALETLRRLEPTNPLAQTLSRPNAPPSEELTARLEAEVVAAQARTRRGEPPPSLGVQRPPSADAERSKPQAKQAESSGAPLVFRDWDREEGLRRQPGVATISRPLPTVTGQWLRGTQGNVGFAPGQVAAKLEGRRFRSFDEFRQAFWKAVADTPEIASQFRPSNLGLMRKGYAPIAPESQHHGSQESYILHHRGPIAKGGEVYDMSNIAIVTPAMHQVILDPKFHFGRDLQ